MNFHFILYIYLRKMIVFLIPAPLASNTDQVPVQGNKNLLRTKMPHHKEWTRNVQEKCVSRKYSNFCDVSSLHISIGKHSETITLDEYHARFHLHGPLQAMGYGQRKLKIQNVNIWLLQDSNPWPTAFEV